MVKNNKMLMVCLISCLVTLGFSACGKQEEVSVAEQTISKESAETDSDKEEVAQTTRTSTQDTYTVPEISWRLAEPLYEKKDHVVYGFSLADFGVEPNTDEDVSGKIQAALLLLNRAGGGTLYIPAGEYRLDKVVNVPKGVTICGDWKEPVEGDKKVEGTVLKIYAGKDNGNGTAQFVLQPNSCVRDLTIWYPEQTVEDIHEYPATFQLYDPTVWGADYTHVNNVTLVNSYVGVVQGPNGNCSPNVNNLYGTTLKTGLSMDGSVDVGRCDYVYLSADYWIESGFFGEQDEAALRSYLYENATGISIGRVDWSYYANTWIEGYAVGMKLREGEMNEKGNYPNGQVYRHTYTDCAVGLLVEGVSSASEEFAEIKIENCEIGISITDNAQTANGALEFYDVEIAADTYAICHEGEEDVSLLDSTITKGEIVAEKGTLLLAATKAQKVTGSRVVILDDAEVPEIEKAPDADEPVHKVTRNVLYLYETEASDTEDRTDSIQALLDKAGSEGGGIVYVPPGEYCIRGALKVPEGVELKGAVDVGRNPIRIGTIFRVRNAQGSGAVEEATVTLAANSGICGIVFDYPEQDFSAPHAYPYAIRGNGENIYIVNVSLRGAYDGVDLMTNRCDNHYVEYLSGICLNNVIQIGGGSTGGRIYNYQINYICISAGDETKFGTWDNAPAGATKEQEQNAVKKYLQENLVVMRLGDVSDELLYNNFSYNGLIGVQCVEENGNAASGWCIGQGVDYSSRAFDIEALENMGFVNSQLVSYKESLTEVEEICHIAVRNNAKAQFVNVACWAKPNTANLVAHNGKLSVWNLRISDVPATSMLAENDAEIHVVNASYNNGGDFLMNGGENRNIYVNGAFYNAGMKVGNDTSLRDIHNRKERVDVPDNTLYEGDGKLVFAEGFTSHPCQTNEQKYLSTAGNFDQLQPASTRSYVGLVEENGEFYARLYSEETQTYMKAGSVSMGNGDYGLEMRFKVQSINCNEDYGLLFSMAGIKDGVELGSQILFQLNGDYSLNVQGEQQLKWQEGVWYRLRIDYELEGAQKGYTLTLLDDEGKELVQSERILFREELQGENCYLSGMQMVMIGNGASNDGINDMLIDYVIAYKK